MSNPKLKVEGSDLEQHKIEHATKRKRNSEWRKNKMLGAMRIMTDIVIDDRAIALKTRRNFYELKSFGQTMHWSLDKVAIMNAKTQMEHSFIEERDTPFGKTEKISVKPRHITVWEYNPRTSHKRRIA